ncbi:MAG: response regulator transcription factor [Firmicutes bacterium]|jgi:two-component system response regulator VicR|nr:response regulator transcription factor [Bacillota bacterium]
MAERILVVEDEKPIAEIIQYNLEKDGYQVKIAYDGEEALRLAAEFKPELILLDIMLPKLDGITVCKRLRETEIIPIIMLTAKDNEADLINGLNAGADDYITKPFSVRELNARIKAFLRRSKEFNRLNNIQEAEQPQILKYLQLEIDLDLVEARRGGQKLDLTLREFELLKFLAQNKGRVFTRDELLQKVWGFEFFGDGRTVDVTIRRLREKVEVNPSEPIYIETRRGVGYLFNPPKE